jgi:hypothetical protein
MIKVYAGMRSETKKPAVRLQALGDSVELLATGPLPPPPPPQLATRRGTPARKITILCLCNMSKLPEKNMHPIDTDSGENILLFLV